MGGMFSSPKPPKIVVPPAPPTDDTTAAIKKQQQIRLLSLARYALGNSKTGIDLLRGDRANTGTGLNP